MIRIFRYVINDKYLNQIILTIIICKMHFFNFVVIQDYALEATCNKIQVRMLFCCHSTFVFKKGLSYIIINAIENRAKHIGKK